MTTVTSYFDSAEERDAAEGGVRGTGECEGGGGGSGEGRLARSLSAIAGGDEHRRAIRGGTRRVALSSRLRAAEDRRAAGAGVRHRLARDDVALHRATQDARSSRRAGASTSAPAAESWPWPCCASARPEFWPSTTTSTPMPPCARTASATTSPERDMPLFIGRIESLRRGTFDVITMNILAEIVIEPRRHPPASGLQRTAHPQRHPHLAPRRRRLRCQRLSTSPTRGEAKGRMVGGSLRADTAGSADLLARPTCFFRFSLAYGVSGETRMGSWVQAAERRHCLLPAE